MVALFDYMWIPGIQTRVLVYIQHTLLLGHLPSSYTKLFMAIDLSAVKQG